MMVVTPALGFSWLQNHLRRLRALIANRDLKPVSESELNPLHIDQNTSNLPLCRASVSALGASMKRFDAERCAFGGASSV
jgi:hypothetical protein